jgi:transposase
VHARITLRISSTQAAPRCPGCDVPARRAHSHYTRTLADLPWSGYTVTWELRVRQLFCSNTKCPRRIFTERLPGIVAPWARRTLRLMARLLAVALALGGAAGVRLSQALSLTVSRNTLLRVIRRAPALRSSPRRSSSPLARRSAEPLPAVTEAPRRPPRRAGQPG